MAPMGGWTQALLVEACAAPIDLDHEPVHECNRPGRAREPGKRSHMQPRLISGHERGPTRAPYHQALLLRGELDPVSRHLVIKVSSQKEPTAY